MSEVTNPTFDDLLQAMIGTQVSEAEATELFTMAMKEYQNSKGDIEITPTSHLFTPRAWWLMG